MTIWDKLSPMDIARIDRLATFWHTDRLDALSKAVELAYDNIDEVEQTDRRNHRKDKRR